MEKIKYTQLNVIKLKQTYQTTESTCSQERWHPNRIFYQMITYYIQFISTMKCLPASSANVNCHNTMTLIHIFFSKQKKRNYYIFLIVFNQENSLKFNKNEYINTYMIMICQEHVIPSIGEKVHRYMHSTHKFISVRRYCFSSHMLIQTEIQNIGPH